MLLHDTNPEVYDYPLNSDASHWSFLSVEREKSKTIEASIISKVEKITGIKLTNVTHIADILIDNKSENFYQAKLTDDNVNNMSREHGQVLQFFSMKEVEKLNLEPYAKKFVVDNFPTLSI